MTYLPEPPQPKREQTVKHTTRAGRGAVARIRTAKPLPKKKAKR